jgi:hypothetical protein
MKTKNHIKSPKEDSLRGIGKLGWTESGKTISTVRRLQSSFEDQETKSRGKKDTIICPVCKTKFKINNINKIPNHFQRIGLFGWGRNNEICKGSYSKQKSDKFIIKNLDFTSSAIGKITVGDRILVDFSRAILQEYDKTYQDIIELTLLKIEETIFLCNDNSQYSSKSLLYFNKISNSIPNFISITQHMIKVN